MTSIIRTTWNKLAAVFRSRAESSGPVAPEPRAPEGQAEAYPAAAEESEPAARVLDTVRRPGLTGSPFEHAVALTPNDAVELTPSRALWVGFPGSIKVDLLGGAQGVTFAAVPAGALLPIRCTKVYATGTTARGILALY